MSIVDWIFPRTCVGCGREGEYICAECQSKLVKPKQICPMCGRYSLDGWTHVRCKRGAVMERLVIGLTYRGMVQQCLKKVKYKGSWEIISFLFELWQENCRDTVPRDTVITSVPMYQQKERERGFNQAERIARCLGNPIQLLERVRATEPMFGLTRKARKENISGAFRVNVHKSQMYTNVHKLILVDDVWTTGATMRECARVLKKRGIEEIWGVALAG